MFETHETSTEFMPPELITAAMQILHDEELTVEEDLKNDARAFLSCQFRRWTYAEEDDDQETAE